MWKCKWQTKGVLGKICNSPQVNQSLRIKTNAVKFKSKATQEFIRGSLNVRYVHRIEIRFHYQPNNFPNDYKRNTNSLTKPPLGEFQIITNKQEERSHQIDEPKSSEPELKKTQNNEPNILTKYSPTCSTQNSAPTWKESKHPISMFGCHSTQLWKNKYIRPLLLLHLRHTQNNIYIYIYILWI